MIKKAFSTISFLFLITVFVGAQKDTIVILPGSELVDGTIIKPYTNKWKLHIETAEGEIVPQGVWTDYGQIIELEKKKYFHRVQDLYDAEMNLLDTWINLVELETLIPVRFSTINPQGGFSNYEFERNNIKGKTNLRLEEQGIETINASLKKDVFDWKMYGMLLVGLPLKSGLIAKLPFYDSNANVLDWLIIHVKEQELITTLNNEKVKTWKIETNQRLVFWISEKAPYVIKLELTLQNNSTLVWEVF